MVNRIEQDHARFKHIVRGTIRKDLRRFIAKGELIGKEGKRLVSIPVHDIDIPTFRYGDNAEGVGQGPGQPGDQPADGSGPGQGGEQEGRHILEVDVTIEELADILGQELKLPRIEPKGRHNVTTTKDKYSGVRPVGPAALRHFKRTYKEALKRQIAQGLYDPDNPVIIPVRDDHRYRSWVEVKAPQSNAAIIYMMDVSGSMGSEQKELVRLQAFWIDTWLRRNYQGVESTYVVHDVAATQVDRATFFSVREDGGTRISSAIALAGEIIAKRYNPADWNTYVFHFSDGDNSSDSDNRLCVDLLKRDLLPAINQFGYVQVKSAYGSGQFHSVLSDAFPQSESHDATQDAHKVVVARVNERTDVLDALRLLFQAGR
jgi:uncharacterized sporulation protein YeaH/YhbH (DUF444 family)